MRTSTRFALCICLLLSASACKKKTGNMPSNVSEPAQSQMHTPIVNGTPAASPPPLPSPAPSVPAPSQMPDPVVNGTPVPRSAFSPPPLPARPSGATAVILSKKPEPMPTRTSTPEPLMGQMPPSGQQNTHNQKSPPAQNKLVPNKNLPVPQTPAEMNNGR